MSRAAVRRDWVSLAVLILGAIAFAVGVLALRARDANNLVAYDFYGQFYPFMVHAWRSLSGGGLLWNPYQDCGQPFFGNSQTGLLYPVNVLFAVLPREPALVVSAAINLAIAGVGMFLLCREMRIGRAASLCGALAFQLGWAASMLAAWSPTHIAPFAWLPVAMWRTECLLRTPGVRAGLWLALVLAIQLLPGFPQTVFFTYQVIALRVLWTVLTRETRDCASSSRSSPSGSRRRCCSTPCSCCPPWRSRASRCGRDRSATPASAPSSVGRLAWQTLVAQVAEPGNALILLIALLASAPRGGCGVAPTRRSTRSSQRSTSCSAWGRARSSTRSTRGCRSAARFAARRACSG